MTSSGSGRGAQEARELEAHLRILDGFTGAALGVLAVASGIYTYLGVSSLLDGGSAMQSFAAIAYSTAVSVGIFVFWSYMLRLFPAVRTGRARAGLLGAMGLGSLAIVAMSSWLNAAALAGAAAVEQHLAETVQEYQGALERAHEVTIAAQGLERDVARTRQSFEDLSEQEAAGALSGLAGRGAVFRVLRQKSAELSALESQIATQAPLADAAFAEGNTILSRMRALTVEPGPVEARSVEFSEQAVRLAGIITRLRQLSVAQLVQRAAQDLSASVVLPELDGSTADTRLAQGATITSVLEVLGQRAATLQSAAEEVMSMQPPSEITYTPLSAADAVILYARNFVPSWAGAIAIDLLPAVLVLIVAVTQGAIRAGRDGGSIEDRLTVADLRAALQAVRDVDLASDRRGSEATATEGAMRFDGMTSGGPVAEPGPAATPPTFPHTSSRPATARAASPQAGMPAEPKAGSAPRSGETTRDADPDRDAEIRDAGARDAGAAPQNATPRVHEITPPARKA